MFKNKNCKYIILLFTCFSIVYNQNVQNLKTEYEKYKKDQADLPASNTGATDIQPGLSGKAAISPYQFEAALADTLDIGLKYFGYDFFTSRDTVNFWENLPTPANYLLGAGDELIISLWGETQIRKSYTISRDGKIYDDKVGLLNITGKSLDESNNYLVSQFGRVYATLKGKTPSTFMDISLGKLKSINVNFVGRVKYPGVYPIHPFSTIITGLIQAGGVDTTGSLREIELKRNNKLVTTIDLYDYFIKGDLPSKIQLRDQDVIVVPSRSSIVKLDSAVVNPGYYESIGGETISDMISYAGGLTYNASGEIGIKKIKPNSKRKNGINFESFYVDIDDSKLIPVSKNDHIMARYIFNELQQVEIIGQVKAPGIYHYYNGMNLRDLILLGGGFEDSTFRKTVHLDNAEIIRRNPNKRYDDVISIDLNNIFLNENKGNILIQNLDRLVIHSNPNYVDKKNIKIIGEVNVPGSYPLIKYNETLESLINRAGGYTTHALRNGISIFRDERFFEKINIKKKEFINQQSPVIEIRSYITENTIPGKVRVAWENKNIVLMPGDSIIVRESTQTVNVIGEVYNPGLIEYRQNKSLKYYINAAGGITNEGSNKNIVVIHANGMVNPKKWNNNPKVHDGTTILVHQKENLEPFNPVLFAGTMASFVSSVVTIIVLSKQL